MSEDQKAVGQGEPQGEAPNTIDVIGITREQVESDEEWWFAMWCQEALKAGLLEVAEKNLNPIQLSFPVRHQYKEIKKTKKKAREMSLFNDTVYTNDFNLYFNPEWENVFYMKLMFGERHQDQKKIPFITVTPTLPGTAIEIKADYTKPSELQIVNLKRKWIMQQHQWFIQLVRVPTIFEETFYPKAFLDHPDHIYKRDNKPRGIKKGDSKFPEAKTVDKYIKEISVFKDKQSTFEDAL